MPASSRDPADSTFLSPLSTPGCGFLCFLLGVSRTLWIYKSVTFTPWEMLFLLPCSFLPVLLGAHLQEGLSVGPQVCKVCPSSQRVVTPRVPASFALSSA